MTENMFAKSLFEVNFEYFSLAEEEGFMFHPAAHHQRAIKNFLALLFECSPGFHLFNTITTYIICVWKHVNHISVAHCNGGRKRNICRTDGKRRNQTNTRLVVLSFFFIWVCWVLSLISSLSASIQHSLVARKQSRKFFFT